jgi:hypothetical protein
VENFWVNDAGVRDIFPVLAKICSFGYGESGTFGFYHALGKDRFHDFHHSDFFEKKFIQDYWCPIFERNQVAASPYVRSTKTEPRLPRLLAKLPSGSMPILILVFFAVGIFVFFDELTLPVCQNWPTLTYCRSILDCSQAKDFEDCMNRQ